MRYLIFCAGLLPLIAQDTPKPAPEPAAATAPAQEAAPAAAGSSRTVTGSVELGYRWHTDVAGDYDAYRSVVNLGEGPKVLNFDFSLLDPSAKWYDKVTVFGSGWGGDPSQTARLDVSKQRLYDFHFDYRNIAYYNFLGSFADPLIDQGTFKTQEGFDIRRRNIDTEIRFHPGARISPYLAYGRNWGDGLGVTTYVTGSVNDYPVATRMYDKTDQYRAGVNLEFTKFHVTLEQGGTTFKDDQTLSNATANAGSRSTSYVAGTLSLVDLLQAYRVRGNGIFERVIATWTPFSWVDFAGSFLFSQPTTDVKYTQTATGSFVDPYTLQVMSSQTMFAAASSNEPHSSGNINVELRPVRRVRILESWMTDRYHTSSMIDLNNLSFLTTPVFANPGADRLAVNYSRQQVQALVEMFPWLTARVGWRYVWGDAVVRAPIENDVKSQTGKLEQNVALLGFQVRAAKKLWVNGDGEIASTPSVYFRTSLADYRKGTVRARYQVSGSLSLTANLFALTNSNPNPDIQFSLHNYQESVGFLWNPKSGKQLTFMGDYTRSSLETSLNYFIPQTLTPELSQYHENAHTLTGLVDVASPVTGKYAPKLSAGGSFFTSSGSRPTSFYSPILKLSLPVREHVQFFTEWRYYGLSETLYSNEGFRTNLFVTGLRLVR